MSPSGRDTSSLGIYLDDVKITNLVGHVLVACVLQVEESEPYVKQYGEERLPKYLQVNLELQSVLAAHKRPL